MILPLQVLVTNLVDSNVFVRSVILSLDFFKRSRQIGTTVPSAFMPTNSENYKFGDTPWSRAKGENEFCMITAFVSHNTLRLLRDLMCSVRLSDINQVIRFFACTCSCLFLRPDSNIICSLPCVFVWDSVIEFCSRMG